MRHARRSQKFILTLAIFTILALQGSAIHAYILITRGQVNPNLRVNSLGLAPAYATAYSNSRDAWFNTYTRANIIIDNTVSDKKINSAYLADSYYGVYRPTGEGSNGRATGFTITLNDRTVLANNSFRQSVIVHEFGHAFSLGDNPSTGNNSMMNYGRDRYTVVIPTQDDINGVNAAYPH